MKEGRKFRFNDKREIVKIGEISKKIENDTNGTVTSADICIIDCNLYTHINKNHFDILELDTDAVSYVNHVIRNFYEIRKGSGKSFMLIAPPHFLHTKTGSVQKSKNVAYIVLQENQIVNDGEMYTYWEVKSAHPRRDKNLKTDVVWKK